MDARLCDFKRAEASGLLTAFDVALEAEAEDDEPVGIAARAALFNRFVDGVAADGAELGAEVEVGFALAARGLIEGFGVEIFVREQFDAGEAVNLFRLSSVLDADAFEVVFDDLLERAFVLVCARFVVEVGGRDGFKVLQGFDGERAADAQAFRVNFGFVVERFGWGGSSLASDLSVM